MPRLERTVAMNTRSYALKSLCNGRLSPTVELRRMPGIRRQML